MKLSEMSKTLKNENSKNENKIQEKSKEDVAKEYAKLQNCSADELMNMLAKEVEMKKSQGTFDYNALRNSIEMVKGYLPTATYQNMIKVIEQFK